LVAAGRFAGQVALVTGAGSGIGEAAALKLAEGGATVAALDIRADRADALAGRIDAAGGRALTLAADVADEAAMRAAFARLVAAAGRLDLIVANAGINGVWAPIDDLGPAEWDRTIAANLRGTYLTLHLGVPLLKAAGGGAVVVVASINGTRTFSSKGAGAYAAAKAGQAALADQLALELAPAGIRVNTVCPGTTETNMYQNTSVRNVAGLGVPVEFPMGDIPLTGGRPARPADIADAICLLLSPEARHVTGTRAYVDGGQSLIR
jgi:NAD(P)-dependent dehydrogenase (short-subunit alcohol dehydrogenase family)